MTDKSTEVPPYEAEENYDDLMSEILHEYDEEEEALDEIRRRENIPSRPASDTLMPSHHPEIGYGHFEDEGDQEDPAEHDGDDKGNAGSDDDEDYNQLVREWADSGDEHQDDQDAGAQESGNSDDYWSDVAGDSAEPRSGSTSSKEWIDDGWAQGFSDMSAAADAEHHREEELEGGEFDEDPEDDDSSESHVDFDDEEEDSTEEDWDSWDAEDSEDEDSDDDFEDDELDDEDSDENDEEEEPKSSKKGGLRAVIPAAGGLLGKLSDLKAKVKSEIGNGDSDEDSGPKGRDDDEDGEEGDNEPVSKKQIPAPFYRPLLAVVSLLSALPLVGGPFSILAQKEKLLRVLSYIFPLLFVVLLAVFMNWRAVPPVSSYSFPDQGHVTTKDFVISEEAKQVTAVMVNDGGVIAHGVPTIKVYGTNLINPVSWFKPQEIASCTTEPMTIAIDQTVNLTAKCTGELSGINVRAAGEIQQ